MRRKKYLVAIVVVFAPPELFDCGADTPGFGAVGDQPTADLFRRSVQVELLVDAAVVPRFHLLDLLHVFVEFGPRLECGTVDSLQHRPLFITAPVGPGDGKQLEGLDPGGVGDMGAAAHICEFAVAINGDLGVREKFGQQFEFVRLAGENPLGVVPAHRFPDKRLVLLHYLRHLGFDQRQVFGHQRPRQLEVIIEAVFDSRADPQFGARKKCSHRLRQHMGCGMAHNSKLFFGGIVIHSFVTPFIEEPLKTDRRALLISAIITPCPKPRKARLNARPTSDQRRFPVCYLNALFPLDIPRGST